MSLLATFSVGRVDAGGYGVWDDTGVKKYNVTSFDRIYDPEDCYGSMQGYAHAKADGRYYGYAVKVRDDNGAANIIKYDQVAGSTSIMKNADKGTDKIYTLNHANDIDLVNIDGTDYIFVATMGESPAIVKLKVSGTKYWKVAEYKVSGIIKDGADEKLVSGVSYVSKTDTTLTFLLRSGTRVYRGTIGKNSTSGTVNCNQIYNLDLEHSNYTNCYFQSVTGADLRRHSVNGQYKAQGFCYRNNKMFLAISKMGSCNSFVLVYDININATSVTTIQSNGNYSFELQVSDLKQFEMEDISVKSDGSLFFSCNATNANGVKNDFFGAVRSYIIAR